MARVAAKFGISFRTLCENFNCRSFKVRSLGHIKWPHLTSRSKGILAGLLSCPLPGHSEWRRDLKLSYFNETTYVCYRHLSLRFWIPVLLDHLISDLAITSQWDNIEMFLTSMILIRSVCFIQDHNKWGCAWWSWFNILSLATHKFIWAHLMHTYCLFHLR